MKKMKEDCDNCKHFSKEHFESHLKLPCNNRKMKKDFVVCGKLQQHTTTHTENITIKSPYIDCPKCKGTGHIIEVEGERDARI